MRRLELPTSGKSGQSAKRFRKEIRKTVSLNYQLFLPSKYGSDRTERWPLMLFLHGAGERGNDIEQVKKHGPPKLVRRRKAFSFIVVSPQCARDRWWDPDALTALLDDIVSRYLVDENRVYVTGLSMGGYGSWALGGTDPNRFAAIAPICGGGMRMHARRIAEANLPVWAFHGAKDKTVGLEESQRMVDFINTFDGNAKLTVYPKAQHDSWTETYENPELYTWLLSHHRRNCE
jgi:predicted peptidase